jgi:hypothetical protein
MRSLTRRWQAQSRRAASACVTPVHRTVIRRIGFPDRIRRDSTTFVGEVRTSTCHEVSIATCASQL